MISTEKIKELREKSGAGILECKKALEEVEGDLVKALANLKVRGLIKVEKKAQRAAGEGLIEAYVHPGERIGAMVEVNCETDFAAHTQVFRDLAHNVALQVAALSPKYIRKEEIPEGAEVNPQEACLLLQPFIKEPEKTIQDIVNETIAKVGENVKIKKFARFELGES